MNLIKSKVLLSYFLLLASCSFSHVLCQEIDPIKKYDELIKPQETTPTQEPIVNPETKPAAEVITEEKLDEIITLLPKLDPTLYSGWNISGKPEIWTEGNPVPPYFGDNQELFTELKLEKILKQTYVKENHTVDVLIYKFKDFTGAYSTYTVLHGGATTKLKVGRNASESEKLVNFWKGIYFIDIHTSSDNDSEAKEFIILASQDISKNIQIEQVPPVVAIQLPALNRIQGTERYCTGNICCNKFLNNIIDFNLLNLPESGGIISAQYQTDDSDKERISLILARYTTRENAQTVFSALKGYFENKKTSAKDMEIDFDVDNSVLKIKNKKNNYTMLKQKGNLVGIAYDITDKKSGEQVLALIPWPIEITKPINTITNTEK